MRADSNCRWKARVSEHHSSSSRAAFAKLVGVLRCCNKTMSVSSQYIYIKDYLSYVVNNSVYFQLIIFIWLEEYCMVTTTGDCHGLNLTGGLVTFVISIIFNEGTMRLCLPSVWVVISHGYMRWQCHRDEIQAGESHEMDISAISQCWYTVRCMGLHTYLYQTRYPLCDNTLIIVDY